MSRNSKTLSSFVKYCKEHPHDRFWQAIRNWSGYAFILATNDPTAEYESGLIKDTFYWEGREK